MTMHERPCLLCPWAFTLLVWLVALLGPNAPATHAQTVTVQNGAMLRLVGGGVLDLHGSTLDFGPAGETAWLEEVSDGRVTGGLLTATRELSAPSEVDVAGLGATISSGQTLGATTITRGHAVQFGGGNASIQRYYDVAPAINSGLGATFTFRYHEAELGGLPEGELELFRSPDGGATWSRRGFDSRDPVANTVTLGGIEAFSRWTLGASSQPLPVELTAFEAALDDAAVQLVWTTASETNNTGFGVERATEGEPFREIGFIAGAGTTSASQTYRFADRALPFAAERFRYRLRQIDVDGAFTYSSEVEVELSAPKRLALHPSFPNPARRQVMIRYELPRAERVHLDVYDVAGRRVATLVNERQAAGRKEITFEAGHLPSGVYFLRLAAENTTQLRRMTVVR